MPNNNGKREPLNNGYNSQKVPKGEFPEQGNFSASNNHIPPSRKNNGYNPQLNTNHSLPNKKSGLNERISNAFNNKGINSNYHNNIPQDKAQKNDIKEGAKKAANSAAGPLGGAAVEGLSKTEAGQKALDTANNVVNKAKKVNKFNPLNFFNKEKNEKVVEEETSAELMANFNKKVITPFIISLLIGIAVILTLVAVNLTMTTYAPMLKIKSVIDNTINDFTEKLTNFLGMCYGDECDMQADQDFYDKINEVYEYYQNEYNVQINRPLLVATLTYFQPFQTAETTTSDGELDQPSSFDTFRKSKAKIKELASNMVTEHIYCSNGDTNETVDCDDASIKNKVTETYWELDEEKYKQYLLDTFVKKYYFNNQNIEGIDTKVKYVVDEIYERMNLYESIFSNSSSYAKVYSYCSGVTVEVNGIIETVPLEDYVNGVVAGEMGDSFNIEALKAHAIAARTYVLSRTNNCTEMAGNGTNFQVYKPQNISNKTTQAAKETEGLVLIYDDDIFSSEYDSFCYDDLNCPDAVRNSDGSYTVKYRKIPSDETHEVTLSDPSWYSWVMSGQGHARGMSQLVAGQLAKEGYTYDKILKYFYADGVEIMNMVNVIMGQYSSDSSIISDKAELLSRSLLYGAIGKVSLSGGTINISRMYAYNAKNLGQCVWFARSRALELIYYSDMSDADKLRAYTAIDNTAANGEGWFDAPTLDVFEKSTDVNQPRPGAIISWSSYQSLGARHNYGHVAIIESVDYENKTVVMSEGYNAGGANGASTWSNVQYRSRTLTFDQLKSYGTGYIFNGYVYILG